MKAIEYMTEITSDGRIDLSPDTLRRLVDNRRTSVRILILFDDMPRAASRPRFAGRWLDHRTPEAIVAEIQEERRLNRRSEQIDW